jgi:hypothetical protein
MSLFSRMLSLLPSRRRPTLAALPAPDPSRPVPPILELEAQAVHEAPGAAAAPDVVILGGPTAGTPASDAANGSSEVADVKTAPRRRPAPTPADRARYFGAAYVRPFSTAGPAPVSSATAQLAAEIALPLRSLATGPAGFSTQGLVESIEPIGFSAFAVWPENATEGPPNAAHRFRDDPLLRKCTTALRDDVLAHAKSGGLPLRPQSLFDLAMRRTGHATTALLVAHIVAKDFAQGDGETHDRPTAQAFYSLFAASALGVGDTHDWHRFFSLAALSLVTASGGCSPPQPAAEEAAVRLARTIDRVATELRDMSLVDTSAYRAWRWANALSFVEFGLWARRDARALDAARIAIAASLFGLRLAGEQADPAWRWAVPHAGMLREAAESGPLPTSALLTQADGLVPHEVAHG